jgi:hypothetical protein
MDCLQSLTIPRWRADRNDLLAKISGDTARRMQPYSIGETA